jgi:hypothetical protein
VGISIPPLQFLAVPLFDMVLFATFVWLAIAQRRKPQSHKRWMLLATVNVVTAAIARWPGVLPLGPLAFFGHGLVRDRVGDLGFPRARPTASSHALGRLAYHRFAAAAARRVEY